MRDYKYGDLYFDTQHDKQMKIEVPGIGITIDNSMIEQEAFELSETLCSESELKFGRCEANSVKFTVHGIPRSIKGEKISVAEEIDGNTDVPFHYGKYKVQSDIPTSDRTKREITAYDAMYDIINADVKPWYVSLQFPMKLRAFRYSFFAYLGIEQKETALVNDEMTVNKTLNTESSSESNVTEVESISGKTVIEAICEINGVFGNVDRDGLFEYVELKPIADPLYPARDLYPINSLLPREPGTLIVPMEGNYITFDYEDYNSNAITHLEIRTSDDSAGITVGKSGNSYVISGNFLVSDKIGSELESIAENTLSVIKKVSYTPIKSSTCVGNPCIELGDAIRFNTSRDTVESYVLQRTLTGIQSKRDNITSHGTEIHSTKVNSIKDTISNLSGRTNKLERTADHTLSEIVAVDKKVDELDSSVQESVSELGSKIEQTASSITMEVSEKITKINDDISSVDEKVDGLSENVTSSVTELNSKIEQTSEQIKLEVSKETDSKLGNYSTTEETKSIIEQTANGTKEEIKTTLETTYSTKEEAKGYAKSAEENSNDSTDEKLKSYSTTKEMNLAIDKSEKGIKQTVSETYSTKEEAKGYASDAKDSSNGYTDEKLKSYSTTIQMKSDIEQAVDSIKDTVSVQFSEITNIYPSSILFPSNDNFTSDGFTTSSQAISTIDHTVSGINQTISETVETLEKTKTRTSTLEQTVNGFSARLFDDEADIEDASKTATDFLQFDKNGLQIGNSSLDRNVLIDSESVNIRSGSTKLASFDEKSISLGKNYKNGGITISSEEDDEGNQGSSIFSDDLLLVYSDGDVQTDEETGYEGYGHCIVSFSPNSTEGPLTKISSSFNVDTAGGSIGSSIYIGKDYFSWGRNNYEESFVCDIDSCSIPERVLIGTIGEASIIQSFWSDLNQHDLIVKKSDGLTSYFGPSALSNNGELLDTTTFIRGRTVRIYNHSGGGVYLGSSGSVAITSDKNLKKDICDMDNKYESFFYSLRPVSYKYDTKENSGHRDHLGFIAQDVEDGLISCGLTTEQFAGIVIEKDVDINNDYDSSIDDSDNEKNTVHYDKLYSLRYEEFIALNTHMIQKQSEEIKKLKEENTSLQNRLSKLEKEMEELLNGIK